MQGTSGRTTYGRSPHPRYEELGWLAEHLVYVVRLASPECFKVGICRSTRLRRRLSDLRSRGPTVVCTVAVANRAEAAVVEYAALEQMHPWLLDLPFKSFGGRTEVWSPGAPEMIFSPSPTPLYPSGMPVPCPDPQLWAIENLPRPTSAGTINLPTPVAPADWVLRWGRDRRLA